MNWQVIATGFLARYDQVADLGPYTGPWPLLPTAVMHLNDDIEFIVASPSPSGDLAQFLDGSYPSDYYVAGRYDNSAYAPPSSYEYYYSGHSPAGNALSPDRPPGARLVVGNASGAPLATPPESYVPSTYSVLGTAAVQTLLGHWSAPALYTRSQPIDIYQTAGGAGSRGVDQVDHQGGQSAVAEPITSADISAADADLEAFAAATFLTLAPPGGGSPYSVHVSARKYWGDLQLPTLPWSAGHSFDVGHLYFAGKWDGTPAKPGDPERPAALGSAMEGITWAEDPYNGRGYDYLAPASPVRWSMPGIEFPRNIFVQLDSQTSGDGSDAALPSFRASVRAASGDGVDFTVSTVLNRLDPSFEVQGFAVPMPPMPPPVTITDPGGYVADSGTGQDTDLSFPGITTDWLMITTEITDPGGGPPVIPNFPMPIGGGTGGSTGYELSVDLGIDSNYYTGNSTFGYRATAASDRPYRSWIPGGIGPLGGSSYLRMNQRNDTLGILPNARLQAVNGSSTIAEPAAPRVGGTNQIP